MNRIVFFFLSFILVALSSCVNTIPPNVILIMTDDQGYGDIGAHGSPYVKTPSMDKLHDQSIRLVNFHVDPCCAPTRSALLTGQYSSRTGVWHTIGGRSLLGTNNVTMAEIFRDAGYKTAIFGKWHLGENYPFRPMDRGFDESLIHGGGTVGANPDFAGNDYYDDTYIHNGVRKKYDGYCNTVWFTEAMNFIKKNKDNPFFCYVSTNVPHAPLNVDSSYSDPYRSMVSDRLASYYGMITKVDEDLGIFVNELEQLELIDNTILIFMTDNGPCPWFGGIIIDEEGFVEEGYSCDMRGGKIWGYENAHRVPCFIRWPDGELLGGRDVSSLTAHIDLLPTLAEWCELGIPQNADFDGVSLDRIIRKPDSDHPERTLFVHNQRVDFPIRGKDYQVLTERWRLVKRKKLELYDILADPGQRIDLASQYPGVIRELKKEYEVWWKHISSNVDQYNPIILGNKAQNPSMIYSHDSHRVKGEPHYYVVKFDQKGQYVFTPFLRPEESGKTLKGSGINELLLQVGERFYVQDIDPDQEFATIKANIEPGQTYLRVWFKRDDVTVNPYSILVERN